jgi:hypothetical protein
MLGVLFSTSLVGMFSGGYIDKFNGIYVVIYHIFSHGN